MTEEQILKPRKALNPAYLKVKPNRIDIERFKNNLITILDQSNDKESEEFHKNLVIDFLKKTWYDPNHYINTKGRNDLVIHNGNKAGTEVGVIIEAKKPTNKSEMPSRSNLNSKAFQELVLYYLRERIIEKNTSVRHLIVTNIYEWFIVDAIHFDRHFAQNKKLVKDFEEFTAGSKADIKTDFFYKAIAEPELEKVKDKIPFTYFDFREYEKPLRNTDKADDAKLIALFKLLSPEHLLKLPFANDSNSLDKKFYSELLHLIGLTETKDGGKKLIGRPKKEDRHPGSLLENTINQLQSLDKLSRLDRPSQYGATEEERLFSVGLELCITWVNRILFLKLLEAQLLSYNKGNKVYNFLSIDKISDFDELNSLFFEVLARKSEDRITEVKTKFAHVPYLNSSLFEPTEMEHNTLLIANLKNERKLPILSSSVLKDGNGKKLSGEINALEYFFRFLDSYDFSSERSEEIQEENKTLINASVLGLIFEKINGYKDGSFFTPGFITMYMCRETIRRAVVQKFKEEKSWNIEEFEELYDKIEDRQEANSLINSLKICDPAVGSGHFLVSALNEIIAVKNDLRILQDRNGKRLKEYGVTVVNDELVVTDEDGELYKYNPNNPESQRIQETLFHEKQTIIENCLFGVDINPNSVKICRLRLWIELLKSAYYKKAPTLIKNSSPVCYEGEEQLREEYKGQGVRRELETLPNIDINIKCGNSLVSRFAIDADLSQALKKSKWTIDSYRLAVDTYRNAESKDQKREMERLILEIKQNFSSTITMNNPIKKRLDKLASELYHRFTGTFLFEPDSEYGGKKGNQERKKEQEKLELEIEKLSQKIDEIKESKIYQGSFEWRFEFPEVLDNDGNFIGFDVVIGNPPYIRIQDLQNSQSEFVEYLNKFYQSTGQGNYDIYIPFIELGYNILKEKSELCYIMPHKFLNANYGSQIRSFLKEKTFPRRIIHFGSEQVFEDATTYTGVFFMSKEPKGNLEFLNYEKPWNILNISRKNFSKTNFESLTNENWIFLDSKENELLDNLKNSETNLESVTQRIFQGLKTSADKIYIVQKLEEFDSLYRVFSEMNQKEFILEKNFLFPLIKGGNSRAYSISEPELLILFPYTNGNLVSLDILLNQTPKTYEYLNINKEYLENRESGKMIGEKWFGYVYPKALNLMNKPKIFTPDLAPSPRFSYDENGEFMFTGGASGGYGIIPKEGISPYWILGILNSKVSEWYIKKTSTQMRGGWFSFESRYIKGIPFPVEKNNLEIERLVKEALADGENRESIKKQINQLVYELYELTDEEIRIVEN